MYDRILVPLDGSVESLAALAFVKHLAPRAIRLLRVEANDHLLVPPSITGVEPGWDERFGQRIEEDLEAVAGPLRDAGQHVEVDVRFGDASSEIIAAAEDADLVVMTTHGRGAAGRLIFGSTADRVVRHGTTPTLLIRRGGHEGQQPAPTRVVVPLDGSPLAEAALPEAVRLASVLGVPVRLVRVVSADDVLATVRAEGRGNGPPDDDAYERARLATEGNAESYLAARASAIRAEDLTVEAELLRGTPAFALLDAIRAEDVVVMSTHGRGGYRRWMLGSVAEKLVREAAAPVLLVRDAA